MVGLPPSSLPASASRLEHIAPEQTMTSHNGATERQPPSASSLSSARSGSWATVKKPGLENEKSSALIFGVIGELGSREVGTRYYQQRSWPEEVRRRWKQPNPDRVHGYEGERSTVVKLLDRLRTISGFGYEDLAMLLGFEEPSEIQPILVGEESLTRTVDIRERVKHLLTITSVLDSVYGLDGDGPRNWWRQPLPSLHHKSPLAFLYEDNRIARLEELRWHLEQMVTI